MKPQNSDNSSKDLMVKAFHFHSKGEITEAAKYYQKILERGFTDPRVLTNYGSIFQQLGQPERAVQLYKLAIELYPNSAQAYNNLGGILKDLGKLKEAEEYLVKAIKIKPDNAFAHSNLGCVLKGLGKLKDAECSTRKAIQINPNSHTAYSNLGGILKDLGKLDEAESSTRRSIELNPNNSDSYSNLGCILKDLGKSQEAELLLKKAIGLNPKDSDSYSNLAGILKDLGKLKEAEIAARKSIELNPNNSDSFSNLGCILKDLGQSGEAEVSFRKAIELNPLSPVAYSNLGSVLKDLGKLKEAEEGCVKAIKLNPDFARPYYMLSVFNSVKSQKDWEDYLFSSQIIKAQKEIELIDIYFARANLRHKQKNYLESSELLKKANKIKQKFNPSNHIDWSNKSKQLLVESQKQTLNKKKGCDSSNYIFIVGMPRSGSTLVESIITMNKEVYDLGELNILEECYLEWKQKSANEGKESLYDLYSKKVNLLSNGAKITTNKWLYNYQYAGIIIKQLPRSKIIHCHRNPFDNILSIYRTNFASGNNYSSSLVDSSKVYLDQDEIMAKYKKQSKSNIYSLNYDLLASNPQRQIQSLVSWLGWEWEDLYLSPHLNLRAVSTASNIQVRSPINANSIDGWKNYKEMLSPAIEVFKKSHYSSLDIH